MLRLIPVHALIIALSAMSFPSAFGSDNPSVSSSVVGRLCQQIKDRKTMIVDKSKPDIVWSDGAMMEVAKGFPAALQELISSPTREQDLQTAITRLLTSRPTGWTDARIGRAPPGNAYTVIESVDGKMNVHVSSVYMDYLHARYPRARIRIRTALDPILFMVDDVIRGTVMPLAMPK